MSGFPGPEGYSETLARQLREERERERGEAMHVPPERSPNFADPVELLKARAKVCIDLRDQHAMQLAADYILELSRLIDVQSKMIRVLRGRFDEQPSERRDS